MAKFTADEKLQAALRYLKGNKSSIELAESIETNHETILRLIKTYTFNS